MKTLISLVLLVAFGIFSQAQKMEITVTNINQKGTLYVGIFDSSENWISHKTLHGQIVEVTPSTSEQTFSFDVPKGKYGVGIYLDTNGNGTMDYGIDPYGFSNHYKPMGYPDFNLFAVDVKSNYSESIPLQN